MKKRKLKHTTLTTSLILILAVSVGLTTAYLLDKTSDVLNSFQPSEVTCAVHEPEWKDGSTIKSNVSIQNTGDTDAYIRAAIVATWQNAAGEVLSSKPVAGTDYRLELNTDGSWDLDTKDGYYYYTSIVPAIGDSAKKDRDTYTSNLIEKCEILKEAPAEGYTLHIEVLASAIQATETAIKNSWSVTYNSENKTISK